ncbi:MAG TPA: glutamate--tRNA ligase family protein [Candidatus Paceibacterota bacterium]|nr:glutamate--tRNA ligase family protein [Candidatus Paceibacterota bacterium]
MADEIRTRIAPSPTGYLHFGTARSALFNYLFAKQSGGMFILRVEDTDTSRNRPEYDADILDSLNWLGLAADRTFRQSEALPAHQAALRAMIEADRAYVSKEPAKDDPSRTVEVIRLRNPGTKITFTDLIRGDITFDTGELGDFVIARSMNEPLYHLAVVVDDHDAGITHVIRGEDHISNTPRQILIQEALGYARPQYAHIPLILAPDRSKMSKRKHETSLLQFRARGYLPEAMVNYLALLGWHPDDDQELFTLPELVCAFDLSRIQKGGAVFDPDKLRWFNKQYLGQKSDAEFAYEAAAVLKEALAARGVAWQQDTGERLAPLLRERVSVWEDLRAEAEAGEYDYFFAPPALDASILPGKHASAQEAAAHLSHADQLLSSLSHDDYAAEVIKEAIWPYAEEQGRGAVLWPLRYALSGRERSPDPFTIIAAIGVSDARARIKAAISLLVQ